MATFPDPGSTRRAWRQKRGLDMSATQHERSQLSDDVLTQPRKRAGPLDAERTAEREEQDMYYRAIHRPQWQSRAGQLRSAKLHTPKSDDLVQVRAAGCITSVPTMLMPLTPTATAMQMAIHDMQRQHAKRLEQSLRDDMNSAAKNYASQVAKEVRRQDAYVKQRAVQLKAAKAREKARLKIEADKDKNSNWLDLF